MGAKNKIVQNSLNIWTLFIFIFFSASVQAATHYVSTDGSASWASSTNINTPCSLSMAAKSADEDDIIYLRGGDYGSQQLSPSNSGSSGHLITFVRYESETPSFTKYGAASVYLNGKSYIIIDGLTFIDGDTRQIYLYNGSSYNEVRNCTFSGNISYASIDMRLSSNYNYIHDNTFGPGGAATEEGDEDDTVIIYRSSQNRIIDNSFSEGAGHAFIRITASADHNVVRGNNGSVTTYWNGVSDPVDKAALDIFIMAEQGARNNLFEENTFIVTGTVDAKAVAWQSSRASYNIIRKNIWDHPGGYTALYNGKTSPESEYNTFYNNTYYITGETYNSNPGVVDLNSGEAPTQYNQFVNNIWYKGPYRGFKIWNDPTYIVNNQFRGNILFNIKGDQVNHYGVGMTLASAQSDHPNIYLSNLTSEPIFTDAANGDFMANSKTSNQVDAGVYLTTITSTPGSGGTVFTVANPYFFYDGWNIPNETGDIIETQKGQTATIISIDYSTGVITVDRSITWTNGEGIALYYQGTRPDIGAKEYPSDDESISSPKGLTIVAN